MQQPEMGERSVGTETGSAEGRSRTSPLSIKQRPGSSLNFLPEDFVPTENSVVCGRGKKCYSHIGNELFKTKVEKVLDEYSRAKTKLDKSGVLNQVVAEVRRTKPGGGFVKQDDSGRWYEVGDFLAREKTSQAFRDALHERYKSSNVSKKKRRKEVMRFTERSQMMQGHYEEDGRPKIELSTGIFSQNYAMDTQQGLLPFSRSFQLTNQSNSNINPAFSAPGSYHTSSALPPLGPSSAEFHALDVFGNRSFNVRPSHHPRESFSVVDAAPFVTNQRQFQLAFEGDAPSSNFRSLPDMRYDMHASMPSFREQMHHSLPNLHFNSSDVPGSMLAAPTQHDIQLQAYRNQTLTQARVERHPGQQQQSFSLEFEPEYGYHPSQPLNPGASLLNAPPAEASRAAAAVEKISVADTRNVSKKSSSPPDDQELLQCLDKLTEYKLSDDNNPYEPVPLGRSRQSPPS